MVAWSLRGLRVASTVGVSCVVQCRQQLRQRIALGVGVVVGAIAVVAVVRAARRARAERRRLASLGNALPYNQREGVVPKHGDRIEMGPAEAVMTKVSQALRGAMRVSTVVTLTGASPWVPHLRRCRASCAQ